MGSSSTQGFFRQSLGFHAAVCVLLITTGTLFQQGLNARPFTSYETPMKPEEARAALIKALDKIDAGGYFEEDETLGFGYRFSNRVRSPFVYDIFVGTISSKNSRTIVRTEGTTGDAKTLTRVLEVEGVITVPPADEGARYAPLSNKYEIIAQPMNLIAPWIGVFYTSANSPRLSSGQTTFRFFMYFLTDVFLVWAAGRNWFHDKYNPAKYQNQMIAVLLVPRIIGAIQTANLVRGHNRLVELKYTFPVD
ncbi:MAG: hypothetical protein HY042_07635 [Spirochaetia bacterium]|nr:hypothetical protein [Spirochaetia bacterium]